MSEVVLLPGDLESAIAARRGACGVFGRAVRCLTSVGSTNDEMLAWAANGAEPGSLVVADCQTAGRGRSGREWLSPAGAGIYFSLLMPIVRRADGAPSPWVTLMAGLAVATALRRTTRVGVSLKWPNDLVVVRDADGERHWSKLGGILAEGVAVGGSLTHVVLGVGVNVAASALSATRAPRATSLEREGAVSTDRIVMIVECLAQLERGSRVLAAGDEARIRAEWEALSPLAQGWPVRRPGDDPLDGVTAGLDGDGALLLSTPVGRRRIVSGELVWA